MSSDMYALPDRSVTPDPAKAAEEWAKAFYQAKDAINRILPVPSMVLNHLPVRDLREIIEECKEVIKLGEK